MSTSPKMNFGKPWKGFPAVQPTRRAKSSATRSILSSSGISNMLPPLLRNAAGCPPRKPTRPPYGRRSNPFFSARVTATLRSARCIFSRGGRISLGKSRGTTSTKETICGSGTRRCATRAAPVFVGQISRDIGVRFTAKAWPPVTHKIDPDIDEARNALIEDLLLSQRLARVGFVDGVGRVRPSNPRSNLTGDPYFTDGYRVVLILDEGPIAMDRIQSLEWESPEAFGLGPAE